MKVLIGGKTISLERSRLIGQGGEAEVYAHGEREVLKVFKQPDHADFALDPRKVAAARGRIDEHQRKLPDFPANLPSQVIVPRQLARDVSSGRLVGYTMKRIKDADTLYKLGDARSRRHRGLSSLTASLVSLHDAVVGLHARGVVIGDFNDLNVLVRSSGSADVHLIDADSFQFGGYRCAVYCERFVDPLLCDSSTGLLSPVRPFSVDSDWYSFALMTARTLLSVEAYGGIHHPAGSAPRITNGRRPFARLSIFNAPVKLPRPALPPGVLSADLLAYLESVFARDNRAPMPRDLLETLRWRRCSSCKIDHARLACPRCAPTPSRPPVIAVPTRITAQRVTSPSRIAALRERASSSAAGGNDRVWLEGRRLQRRGRFGPEHIGDVMASATRFWVGDTFGFGFYAAGSLQFGFVFDNQRGGLNDQVPLEPIRGILADAHATLSETLAWLLIREKTGPSITTRVTVVSRRGECLARDCEPDPSADASWAAGFRGACALGPYLFVPTDAGVVRLECAGGDIVVTKTFPDTADHVDSATTLLSDGSSLYAVTAEHITVLYAS